MSFAAFGRRFVCLLAASSVSALAANEPLPQNYLTELPEKKPSLHVPDFADPLRPVSGQSLRTWSEAIRGRKASARLLAANDHSAQLQKTNGKVVAIPQDALCVEDQDYIRAALGSATLVDTHSPPVMLAGSTGDSPKKPYRRWEWVPFVLTDSTYPELSSPPEQPAVTIPWNLAYVSLSAEFLNRHFAREIDRQDNLTEEILGRPVSGISRTLGRLELGMKPNLKGALVELQFRGTSTSNTTAYDRWARVHSHSITHFDSRKALQYDQSGVVVHPAQTEASTRSSTTGISTDFCRLFGRMVTRIATRQVENTRAQVEFISSTKAATRISQQFDHTFDSQVRELRGDISQRIAGFRDDDVFPQFGFQLATTADALHIVLLRPGQDDRTIVRAPKATKFLPDIEVHLHAAFVDRVLQDANLQKRMRPILEMVQALELLLLSGSPDTVPKISQYAWSEDQNWLTVAWDVDGISNGPQ